MHYRMLAEYLTKENDLWNYQNKPYTGVIFFSEADNRLEPYEVENGRVIKPYISWCMQDRPSPIHINSTGFCNEDLDDYGCGVIQQYYQEKIYQGMSYTFDKKGVCEREIYTCDEGYTESQLQWDQVTGQIYDININYSHKKHVGYSDRPQLLHFSYVTLADDQETVDGINFKIDLRSNRVSHVAMYGNILQTKSYLDIPISLPDAFDKVENYHNFIFGEFLCIEIDEKLITQLFQIWAENKSFTYVERMYLRSGFIELDDITIFSNTNVFCNLEEIWINEEQFTPEQITELKNANPLLIIKI